RARVNVFATYNYAHLVNRRTVIDPAWYLEHEPILEPGRMLRIPGVKIFADGAGTPERGCAYHSFPLPAEAYALYETYGWDLADICGSPQGDLYLTEAQLIEAIQGIQDRGYRAAFHAMGDAAIDAILNALEEVLKEEPNAKYRHQIHHNSSLRPDQLERYVEMDIIASVRSMFNTCEAAEYIALFGEARKEWPINRYQLPSLGIHAIAEGDLGHGDVNDPSRSNQLNPIFKLYGMVTHQQLRKDGSACEPPDWLAQYPISVERALEMLTIESAYAVSMEEYVGSIKAGKYADVVILSGNPLTTAPDDLINLRVRMTMVNGKAEYCAAEYASWCKARNSSTAVLPPEGFHDANEGEQNQAGCLAAGWAADPDDRNLDLKVRILVDGAEVAQTTASDFRQDLKDAGECPGGTCGFSVDLWGLISHNAEHSVLVQAQDAQTGEWVTLNETPKTLNCTGQ
ncbi:MAG: amidohydrolase family protein, partial [Chloroflexota bacterium]